MAILQGDMNQMWEAADQNAMMSSATSNDSSDSDDWVDMICPFKWLTGFPCPGCGMTRAYCTYFRVILKVRCIFIPLVSADRIRNRCSKNPKISKLTTVTTCG